MPSIEVVEYDERWAEGQTAFARRNWPGKVRRGHPDYLRWQYRGPARGAVPGLLLAVQGDVVIGQLGMIPGTIHDGVAERSIQWIGNLMVDPDHRREGVGSAIFDRALARPVTTVGTDPSPSAASTMAALGFARADASDLMVLTLDPGVVVTTRYPELSRLRRPLSALGRPAMAVVSRRLRRRQLDTVAQVCSWRDVVDDVQRIESEDPMPRSLHDEAFLRWRASGFPPWVRACDAVRTPAGSFAIVERADPRLLVLHWHAVDDDDGWALMARVAYIASSYGSAYVQAMANGSQQRRVLNDLGFRARRTPTDLWWYPGDAIDRRSLVVQGYDTDQNL